MPTIAECLAHSQQLNGDTARLDIEVILAHVLKQNRSYLYTWPEKNLTEKQFQLFAGLLDRRKLGEPVAYLVGEKEFWSLMLKVHQSTLIPRPETEVLVECALAKLFDDAQVLDLGTGTGAVALALASEFSQAKVVGVDIKEEAVALAKENAHQNSIGNACFYQSNWFEDVTGCFDLIVTNPPYIECEDSHLNRGDLRFEPASALVSGTDGLDDIRRIVKDSRYYLHDQAWLMIEHGFDQGERVRQLLAANAFKKIETVRDFSGLERVSLAQFND